MLTKANRMDKQKLEASIAVFAAVVTIGGITTMTRHATAAANKEYLKKQRAALGMPVLDEMHARRLAEMVHDLGLTEAQQAQIVMAMGQSPDPRVIFADKSLSMEQKFARMGQAMEEGQARIRAVLTPEQRAKDEKIQAQMRERFHHMAPRSGWPGGFKVFGPPPMRPPVGFPRPGEGR